MARVPRYRLPAFGDFHVTSRGVDRCCIYRDDDDYRLFEAILRAVRRDEHLHVWAWCAMPNHFHLILQAATEQISRAMYRLNGTYAQTFNARYARSGHLFQSRFHAKAVDEEEHLGNACAYVWNNPVRASLCREPSEWRWSGELPRLRLVG